MSAGRLAGWLDRRVELRAVAAGVAADWLGTLLTVGLVGVAFGVGLETSDERLQELLATPAFLVVATAHGTLFTALGGYVAARLASADRLRHAVIAGALSLVLGILLTTAPAEGPRAAWWVDLIGYLLAVPAAAAGGWLGTRSWRRESLR